MATNIKLKSELGNLIPNNDNPLKNVDLYETYASHKRQEKLMNDIGNADWSEAQRTPRTSSNEMKIRGLEHDAGFEWREALYHKNKAKEIKDYADKKGIELKPKPKQIGRKLRFAKPDNRVVL